MKFKNELEMFKFMEAVFYSGALSDILDEMGQTQCAASPHALVRPLFPQAICAGRVRTLLNAPMLTGRENPYRLAIALMDSLQPGEVVLATSTAPLESGIMGELSATAMKSRGARGCLVDGYTRDARKIVQMRFPVFAKGVSPIDTTDRAAVVECDQPVLFAGRRVFPGQIVFADLDGIVFIPKEVEAEVIKEAARRVRAENKVRTALKAKAKVSDVWEKYHVM
ncbi:MAG TPA: RraA family protein [Candidatus Aminicenantes bacterium]|nr:RraA family protein [Candidatus Aminicenantes bacterium]HRY65824.1 RraA family protein [Candidatus Aminicenantes bacterium]HRZ72850.1 RraA family protein [Candidatus Aminicenantes bacterium]